MGPPLLTTPDRPCASRWVRCLRRAPDVAHSSWEVPEGTGVGESRNPSDPASYGLDPKTATLRLKFRVQKTNYSAASGNCDGGGRIADNELPGWEAVLWRGR